MGNYGPDKQSAKQGHARGAREMRRGTSSIRFHPLLTSLRHWPRGCSATLIRHSPFFVRQKRRIFLFFPVGGPELSPNPSPCKLLVPSTRKSRSEVPERGDFGEEDCPGKGGVDRAKKENLPVLPREGQNSQERVNL